MKKCHDCGSDITESHPYIVRWGGLAQQRSAPICTPCARSPKWGMKEFPKDFPRELPKPAAVPA